jgi:aryl-phospho-beta-D-glucosidase BglC (GH1 family)
MGILDGKTKPTQKMLYNTNTKLVEATSLNDLETMVMIAAQKGMLVILDFHSFGPGTGTKDALWYNDQYGEWNMTQAWIQVANRFKKYWNVLGADIRNEMWNGTWGGWDYDHDIKAAQERIGLAILETAPGWVVFVEGTMNNPNSVTENFAGENLIGAADAPMNFTLMPEVAERFFYTPHVYGPAMADFGYFDRDNFSDYMPAIWRSHWGYLQEDDLGSILVGAWGTQVSDIPETQALYDSWSQALVQYLGDIGARDAFYWGVNPDMYGVAGLLQADWVTPNQNPLDWAATLQPNPNKLTYFQRGAAFCLQ